MVSCPGGGFADHFSAQASLYRAHRPSYPTALFEWLAAQSPGRHRAVDCGAGPGQAAAGLTAWFREVVGLEPSLAQLRHRLRPAGLGWTAAAAEALPLRDRCADLVLVAQAFHWFEAAAFFAEAGRVLRPAGLVALVGYGWLRAGREVERVLEELHSQRLQGCWPPGRERLDDGYRSVVFPFPELRPPPLEMGAEWSLGQLRGYLDSWSAVARYRQQLGRDPVEEVWPALQRAWGAADTVRRVRWPLVARVGRVS